MIQLARDVAANDCTSNTMALLSVEPCDRGGACRVKVRLMVEASGVILRPCRRDGTTPPQQQRPPDWTAYTDGSEDGGRAGWAYAVVMGGDGIRDVNAMLVTEGYGPVVTSPVHAAFVGARNTPITRQNCQRLRSFFAHYSTRHHDQQAHEGWSERTASTRWRVRRGESRRGRTHN